MALSLPDGRFITAGTSLRRHLRDGRIDPSFRPGRLGAGRCRYFLDPVLRQPDGRVIAVARQWCGDDDPGVWTLLRFLRNGARDRTFGVGGVSRIAVGISALGSYSGVGKVILLPSGRLVLGGATAVEGGTPTEPDYAFAVARLDAHGRLDGSFGAGGVVRVPVEKGFASFGDLLRRPDGRLLLVGCVPWSQSDSTEVVGLRGDGSLDASWASGGIGTYGGAFPATDLHCGWLAQRPDGGIFVLLNGRLAALTTDGTLDAAFGDEGVVPTRTDDVLLLESGRRVVVAGGVDLPGQQRGVAVFRYRY
jgi:uncharacterized delta-60 repeat protein